MDSKSRWENKILVKIEVCDLGLKMSRWQWAKEKKIEMFRDFTREKEIEELPNLKSEEKNEYIMTKRERVPQIRN